MIEKEVLERLYLDEQKPTTEIAKILNTSVFNVNCYRKKYNIRKLERWERFNVSKFSRLQKEYLLGSLLGDDHIRKNGKYAYLQVIHSSKFKDYVKWKYGIWKKLVKSGVKSSISTCKNKKYPTHKFITSVHPDFMRFRKLFYPDDKKSIDLNILKQLTPFSIAVWYMDDGYYRKERGRATLCTHSFSYKENLLIKKYFEETWRVKSNIGITKYNKAFIWFNTENTIKFFQIIKDFILPSFNYKIDLNRKMMWKKLSEEEIDYIRNNYNKESPRLISHKLNRPLRTIFGTAFRLGVTQRRGGRKYYEKDV